MLYLHVIGAGASQRLSPLNKPLKLGRQPQATKQFRLYLACVHGGKTWHNLKLTT